MPTQLAEDARRRLEAGQGDLRDRCWHNVQRLHKWSGKLEREGPSGEDAAYYESMGPRSLFLGPIVWDGPTDKRQLGWDEITAALRAKVRDLLGRYARDLAALAGGEWWSLGLTSTEFESRMAAVLQSVLADLKNVARDADSDLGLGLEIEPLVAELNTGLQAWCDDYVERYGAHIGLFGTAETSLDAPQGTPPAASFLFAKGAMAHNELPRASADRVRATINTADALLTQGIKWLPTELQDGKRTSQEVEDILCETSKEWAWDVFVTILKEWAEIGIPPDHFDAIAKGQIESLSTHAEERVAAFVSGFHLSSGKVCRSVREFLPGLIPPYREENRFRFHSVMAGGEAATPSKPATPQVGGSAARAEARQQSQEAGRPADNTDRNGASAESAFPARVASLKDRLRVTSIDGSVRWINPEGSDPEASIWTPEDEKRISACVFDGRAAVRSELERIFSGKEWPALAALVEPFRRYAVAVFDVYASAYSHVARTLAAYQDALDQLLLPMVLRDLFGREWDRSPGEKVVRMLWQDGPDGKPEGREVTVVAGNDPDPTCVFYDLLSNAIEHRYRFFEPLPPPAPGEPPGINLTNLEWWQYIGLSERHSLAMAIKPYIEDRVAHWRFIYSPTAPPDSDNTRGEAPSDVAQQPEHPDLGAVRPPASMAARVSSSSGASAMDSPTRVKFEAGLALAEVTLAQDLKDLGPSLEIARKYVTSATLALARCILTPHCEEPYEAIRRAYDFAEWFAAETIKTAWVWLCVFSEMDTSGKLEKYKREGRTEDGPPKGMTEAELREWNGCLSGVAQEALDEFVPEFWKERLKYFSGIAGRGAPTESENPKTTEDRQDPVASVQEPSDSHVDSDMPKQGRTKPRPGKERKGDASLLAGKRAVNFKTAEQYLGLTERQRQNLVRDQILVVEGKGQNKKITTESLRSYLPPENPN